MFSPRSLVVIYNDNKEVCVCVSYGECVTGSPPPSLTSQGGHMISDTLTNMSAAQRDPHFITQT